MRLVNPVPFQFFLVDYAVYNEGHYSLFCGLFYSLIYNCITTYFSFLFCSNTITFKMFVVE